MKKNQYDLFNDAAASTIREYAYQNGSQIYDFMKKYHIGESQYGKIMDAAAQGKKVIAHRLYGHHLVYDFPIDSSENIGPFLEHLFSDLFTKQGIPIIPGEILENTGLLKVCDKLKGSWNFVNGFDLLAGTVSIYQGFERFQSAMKEEMSVDDFKDFAQTIGVGAMELAIALSTANPFLLIGSVLHLTSGLKGMLNDGAVIYFKNIQRSLTIEFAVDSLNVKAYLDEYSVHRAVESISVENSLNEIILPYKL